MTLIEVKMLTSFLKYDLQIFVFFCLFFCFFFNSQVIVCFVFAFWMKETLKAKNISLNFKS